MEWLTHRVTVQHIDGKIVWCEIHRLEDLIECHHLPANFTHPDLSICLETFLNKPQQMFLIHTGGRVNVSVNLENVNYLIVAEQ